MKTTSGISGVPGIMSFSASGFIFALIFVFTIMPVSIAGAGKAALASSVIPGEFISLAGLPDGTVFLLSLKNELVKVTPAGERTVLKLPLVPGTDKGFRFSDLVISGSRVTFCRFSVPKLYQLDLNTMNEYAVIEPKGLDAESTHFLTIAVQGNLFRLRDTENRVFDLDGKGSVRLLPEFALPVPTPEGRPLIFPNPAPAKNGKPIWKILNADGKDLVVRIPESEALDIQGIGVLGFDPKGRLIFWEVVGEGELGNTYTLYAAVNGNIVASHVFEGPGAIEAVKSTILLPDGSVCLMRLAPDKSGVVLSNIRL
jgi:hypothetical protein